MPLIASQKNSPLTLRLTRDLTRSLKRGHPWVYADALQKQPAAAPGTHATLFDKKRRAIAKGFYTPNSPLAFRVCTLESTELLNNAWAKKQNGNRALELRRLLFDDQTSGFRLFNGEGDGLPGLICDIYGNTAVLQLDGPGRKGFWHVQGAAEWVSKSLGLQCVYLKSQSRRDDKNQVLIGHTPSEPAHFLENSIRFTADVIQGQKTGFFLDQRENRQLIKKAAANRQVLNVFGYTGGFSVYAGLGGADGVTTVDIAGPALQAAEYHWQLNHLSGNSHKVIKADAFDFLESAAKEKKLWDLVIVDPPSFAPSKDTVKKAVAAYQNLVAAAAAVTTPNGLLAAASCSSHIDLSTFLTICESGISKAGRRATLLKVNSQPPDHPTPLPFVEFRYLKFVLMRVE